MRRLIIDTETTGLSPVKHQVLTVGLLAADITKTRIKILDQNHILIKHKSYHINPIAMRINKIDLNQHNKIATQTNKACIKIKNFITTNNLQSTTILGHNLRFDKNFLTNLFTQNKKQFPFNEQHEDTMHIWKLLQSQSIVPSHLKANLKTVASYFDIDYKGAHDALADCHITAKAYKEMLKITPRRKRD